MSLDIFAQFASIVRIEDTERAFWQQFPYMIWLDLTNHRAIGIDATSLPDDEQNDRFHINDNHYLCFRYEHSALRFVQKNLKIVTSITRPHSEKALEILLSDPDATIRDEYYFGEYPWRVLLRHSKPILDLIDATLSEHFDGDNPSAFFDGLVGYLYLRDKHLLDVVRLVALDHIVRIEQIFLKRELV